MRSLPWCALALALCVPSVAQATPKLNPFTYTYSTLGEGEVEIEQYSDVVPLRGYNVGSGARQWYGLTQFQTEFEYGITNRLELGLYVGFAQSPASVSGATGITEGTGAKQRLRLRLAEEGEWPVDVALYGELAENDHEVEIEAKIILQKRIGPVRALINLWGEREYYFVDQREWVINPTAALSYQVTPSIHPGIEGWLRAEWADPAPHPRPFNLGPAVYLGPTFSVNFGRFWWTTGVYARMTDRNRTLQPGDVYGNYWLRNIVGIDL